MMEPINPDKFYEMEVAMVIDGKHVIAKVKKWYDDEEKKFVEKIISQKKDSRYES